MPHVSHARSATAVLAQPRAGVARDDVALNVGERQGHDRTRYTWRVRTGPLYSAYRFHQPIRDLIQVVLDRELREDVFERRQVHQLAQPGRGVVGDDAAGAQDHHARADLLDRLELVGAVEDDPLFSRQRLDDGAEYQRGRDVEAGHRLVEDDDLADCGAAPPTAGSSGACLSNTRSAVRGNRCRG